MVQEEEGNGKEIRKLEIRKEVYIRGKGRTRKLKRDRSRKK